MGLIDSLLLFPWLVYVYAPFFYILRWLRPVRRFEVEKSKVLKTLSISEDEWELDKLKDEEKLTFSGSTTDGNFISIQILTHKSHREANIAIYQNGVIYSGTFYGNGRSEQDGKTYRCGPLVLEQRRPFRLWRVFFRGYLEDPKSAKQLVTIGGWWRAISDSQFYYRSVGIGQFERIIYENPMDFVGNLEKIEQIRHRNVINQLGMIHVELTIGPEKYQAKYRGFRERVPITTGNSTSVKFYLSDGNALHYSEGVLDHGLFYRADREILPVTLENRSSLDSSNLISFEFKPASKNAFPVRKDEILGSFEFVQSNGIIVEVTVIKVEYATSTGLAFIEDVRTTSHEVQSVELDSFPEYSASPSERTRRVLPLSNRACQDKSLTGGKGANLARLTAIAQEFTVPSGIVVTTTAFEDHVAHFPKLVGLIRKLDQFNETEKNVEVGIQIEEELKSSEVGQELVQEIVNSLPESEYYAVRSSAVGEDGADLSNAGQLESYLDVSRNEIIEKLKLCWASNYRREVLNYRRNYGQLLNPSMAVVIQTMSRNGVAGVMFTADPVKRDPGKLVINALEGCGEQIVSGEKTPDEIYVDRVSQQIIKPENCCLSHMDIHKLQEVGEYLERIFEGPQDVEFVVRLGNVFVVQSRNVTGLENESKFELYTEFDSSELTEREVLTNGNVGEVLAAPLCPFEAGTLAPLYDKAITKVFKNELDTLLMSHCATTFVQYRRKVFINCSETMLRTWEQLKKDKIVDIVVSGEPMFNEQMFREAEERYEKQSVLFDLKRVTRILSLIYIQSDGILAAAQKNSLLSMTLLPDVETTISTLFRIYEQQLDLLAETLMYHTEISSFSSFTYVIVGMLIRGKDEGDFTNDDISDFANLFSNHSSTDVISADVPSSLKKIANAVKVDGNEDVLNSGTTEESLEVIRSGKTSKPLFEKFIELHGHRGPKELYMDCVTWAENTELLVLTVKSMMNCPDTEKKIEQVDDMIDNLKCKPTGIRRRMLKYFLSQTHRGVVYRENAKNCLVRATHAVRLTLRRIGAQFCKEGFLPDDQLWQHLTIEELHELHLTRSAKLVSRALRRRKIAPEFEGLQFPLMSHGPVVPIKFNEEAIALITNLSLKGTTVCEGKVIARARVAQSLEEAKETQPGEILITKYTDICWSPFFPIIKGIVTEIGGLLSHGAVVAREYGLPSLIAVKNATNYFKTGDLVELDSIKGTISRVEEDNN